MRGTAALGIAISLCGCFSSSPERDTTGSVDDFVTYWADSTRACERHAECGSATAGCGEFWPSAEETRDVIESKMLEASVVLDCADAARARDRCVFGLSCDDFHQYLNLQTGTDLCASEDDAFAIACVDFLDSTAGGVYGERCRASGCGEGLSCLAGLCSIDCTSTADCSILSATAICRDSVCRDACSDASQCPAGLACVSNGESPAVCL